MKKIYHLMLVLLLLTGLQQGLAQSSPNCVTASDDDYFTKKYIDYTRTEIIDKVKQEINQRTIK